MISGLLYFTFIPIPLRLIFNILIILLQIVDHFGLLKYIR